MKKRSIILYMIDYSCKLKIISTQNWNRLICYSFWLTLLNDALPLLERQDAPIFSYEDTCELMSCLEELTTEETDHPRASKLPIVDRTKLIRLALSKNLKEALIHEGSSGIISNMF